MKTPIEWALTSIHKRGLLKTFEIAMSTLVDIEFDLYYGTDTTRRVDMDSLEFESENKVHAVLYQATKTRPLRKLMRRLNVPKNGTFVDLGSGKGRTLLVAMQLGFEKIIGVEFSPELCAVARKNIEIFSSHSHSRVEIVESDVSKYQFDPHSNVFFMYNPFDKVVMDRMIENLRNSLLQSPRQIWLIYNTPLCAELLDNAGLFFSHQDFEIGGTKFRVYNN
jgi:SAM-dependent methyltransferase